MTTSRFYRAPQQSRSRETLDRILDPAEQVLEQKTFNEATLAEIMERAGVTVGAFYRRFPDKDALLYHLAERFFTELLGMPKEFREQNRWHGARACEIIDGIAAQAVEV